MREKPFLLEIDYEKQFFFQKLWYSQEKNVVLKTKFHAEQHLLYEKSKYVSKKLNPRGTAGPRLG